MVSPERGKCSSRCAQVGESRGFPLIIRILLGPDAQNEHQVRFLSSMGYSKEDISALVLKMFASELRLRGNTAIVQPHVKDGNVLCWNGEVGL